MRHVIVGASRGAPLRYSQVPASDVTCELYCSSNRGGGLGVESRLNIGA